MFSYTSRRKKRQSPRYWVYLYPLFLLSIALLWFGETAPTTAQEHDRAAADLILQAWEKVGATDRYQIRTQANQLVYPAPSIRNAGRQPQEDILALEGEVDAVAGSMEMMLWNNASFDPEYGMEMKVENGRSYIRESQTTDWMEVESLQSSFAPNGDPLSFLAGMTNVRAVGSDDRQLGDVTIPLQKYIFDVSGPVLGREMDRLTEQSLIESGELPQGFSPSGMSRFHGATGTGEIWLDPEGYPARLTVDLEFEAEESGERVVGEIQTDFYDFVVAEVAPTPLLTSAPREWLAHTAAVVAEPEMATDIGWSILVAVTLVLLAIFVVRHAHTKEFYNTVAFLVIMGMLLPPLIQAQEAQAYSQRQIVESQEHVSEQKEIERQEAMHAARFGNNWDPQEDPYAEGRALQAALELQNVQITQAAGSLFTANSETDTTSDSDGDGVSDDDEEFWDSCPYLSGTTEYTNEVDCTDVTDSADSDDDGLTDYMEIMQFGTLPDMWDTDGDSITDTIEIRGFSYQGETWYLNPLEDDTNNDGRTDSEECFVWSSGNADGDTSQICPDTDGDGTPDLFDFDDDNDDIVDFDDDSPGSASVIYGRDNPMTLSIDGLEVDKPVLVNMQIRPIDDGTLNASGMVLDWPSGDYEGQIQRGNSTTFADTENTEIQSTDETASNGDIRIIPMLQVTIPYSDGHYANLPVNSDYYGIDRTTGITAGQWLNTDELDVYGISVTDVDESSGDLTMYIPLNTMYSQADSQPIGFSATAFYSPTQGVDGTATWGNDHEYRLLWMVQMITDACAADVDEDDDGDVDNETGADCDRVDELSTIQIYQDDWRVASLSVSEEHGLDTAIMYEDPDEDDNTALDDQLWIYGWNLSNTFAFGLDCDSIDTSGDCVGDGDRDVEITDIETKLDEWADVEGVSENYTEFSGVKSYIHLDYLAVVAVTDTVGILDNVFLSHTDSITYSSVMVVYENTNRTIDLGDNTGSGGDVDLDLTDLSTQTVAALFLKTFTHTDSDGWEEADTETYLTYLLDTLADTDSYFQVADDSEDALTELEGKQLWVQNYYVALSAGIYGVVAIDDTALNEVSFGGDTFASGTFFANAEIFLTDLLVLTGATRLGYVTWHMTVGYLSQKKVFNRGYWHYIRQMYSDQDLARGFYRGSARAGLNMGPSVGVAGVAKQYHSYKLFGSKFLTKLVRSWSIKIFQVTLAIFIVAAILAIIGFIIYSSGGDVGATIMQIGLIIAAVAAIVILGLEFMALIYKNAIFKQKFAKNTKTRLAKNTYRKSYRGMANFGLALSFTVALGMLFYSWHSIGWDAGSPLFDQAAAYFLATIIVELIFFIIFIIFPIGTAIAVFIELVDLVLLLVSFIVKDFDFTISGWLTEAVADLMYNYDLYAVNADSKKRIETDATMGLEESALGYIESNTFVLTLTMTNTIFTTFSRDELRRNTFEHALNVNDDALDGVNLGDGDMIDAWINVSDGGAWAEGVGGVKYRTDKGVYTTGILSETFPFVGSTGINRVTETPYFIESYYLVGEGCWHIFAADGTDYNCKEESFEGVGASELDPFVFDILPDTLAEFILLDWNSDGALGFPIQTDQDNDSVSNLARGGADADDTSRDTDGDQLDDSFETSYGLDSTDADMDDDGLTDYEELFVYYTDPTIADMDGDGLSDYIEAKAGWRVEYIDENGQSQLTRVWSDPYVADLDGDGIGDLQEYIYGFHPSVISDMSAVDGFVEFTNLQLSETQGPLLYLPLDEAVDSTSFFDGGGDYRFFDCGTTSGCPTAEVSGKFGTAVEFDNVNDYLVSDDLSLDVEEFTIAAWVYNSATDNSNQPVFGSASGFTADSPPSLVIHDNQDITVGFGDGSSWNSISPLHTFVDPGWNHVAATYDGEKLKIIVDGNGVYNQVIEGVTPAPITEMTIGRNGTDYLDGAVDEVFVYDRALSNDEINKLRAGQYDLNDLYFSSDGGSLRYQATVSNTTAAVNTDGYLYAAAEMVNPVLPEPTLYLGFDEDQRWATFDNTFNPDSDVYCLENSSTCPTNETTTTAVGTSLEFDGDDDVAYFPTLTSGNSQDPLQGSLAFWLYVETYPSSGTTAMIMDTESTEEGATDIYLDEDGDLYLDAVGFTPIQLTSAITQSEWVHVMYQRGYVYLDGYQTSFDGSHIKWPKFGHGTLGADIDGGQNFDGVIDELVVFYEWVSPANLRDRVMLGQYKWRDMFPHVAIKFEDITRTSLDVFADESQYSNHAYCESVNTCPNEVAGRIGGTAVEFDGVDDYLIQKDSLQAIDKYYVYEDNIIFYIHPTSYPDTDEKAYIYHSDIDVNDVNQSELSIYLDDQGRMGITDIGGTALYSGAIPLNEWTKVKLQLFYYDLDGTGYIHMWRYINGTVSNDFAGGSASSARPYIVYCIDCQDGDEQGLFISSGRIGNSITGTAPFEGMIDDFYIGIADHDFDQYERTLNYVDPVHDVIRTDCDMLENCPGAISGVVDDGVYFGNNKLLDIDEQLEFARGDYAISLWFYADHQLNQTLFTAYDDNGDEGVLIELTDGGVIEFSHNFPAGGTAAQVSSSGVTNYSTTTWHHLVATKDGEEISLYIDGTLVGSTAATTTADENLNVRLGRASDGVSNTFYGALDELAIFDEAVDQDQAAFLMETRYPALEIDVPYEPFSLDSGETKVVSGTAFVNTPVGGSTFAFQQDVEIAIDLETELSYTTYENNDGVWSGYFRFEEVPGDAQFDNLVSYGVGGTSAEVDANCEGLQCPVGGAHGIDGRAAFFDGDDDYMFADFSAVDSSARPDIRSMSVWVKGADGTIIDSSGEHRNDGFQLMMGALLNADEEELSFDMPRNEWTHVALSIDSNDNLTLYVNGVVVIDSMSQTVDSSKTWWIGANYGGQNYFLGYMDEMKLFDVELSQSDVTDLYENVGAEFRFSFDEEYGETNFVDSVNGHVGEAVLIDCVEVTLQTLSGASFDSNLMTIRFDLDGDTLLDDSAETFAETTADLNISTAVCGETSVTLTASGVYSDGTEVTFGNAATLSAAVTGAVTTTMSYNSQLLTLAYVVTQSNDGTSPLVGTDGRIGNTAYFTGEDDGHVEITTVGLGNFSDEDFTLMGWVKTEETNVGILTKSDGDSTWEGGERAFYVAGDGTLEFHGRGQGKIYSTRPITDGTWHHFAFVWDSVNVTGTIAIDGLDVTNRTRSTYDPQNNENSGDTLRIGAPNHNVATDYFSGQLDEMVLYSGRAFTPAEVYDNYQQEARWYRDSASFIVTVDDDAPTVEWNSDYSYRADGYIQLVATASDETSGLSRVRYKYKKSGGSASDWIEAPLCTDAIATVYCPYFESDGEGEYEIYFHMIDRVGHITETTDPFMIYVDTTAPTANGSNDHNNDLAVTITELSDDSWSLAMSGSISDPILSAETAGSGVYGNGVVINLYNEDGTLVGSPNQQVTYDAGLGTWSIDYFVDGEPLAGCYDAHMTTIDMVGNSGTVDLGSFCTDLQAPEFGVALDLLPDYVISQTNTITGVLIDHASYHNPVVNFHFEELAGDSYFYDYGQLNLHVDCSSNCPQTTASGMFGRGLAFNGVDQYNFEVSTYPISDVVNFGVDDEFTIAFWVQADASQTAATGTTNSLVEKWDGSGAYPYAIRYHNQNSSDHGRLSASVFDGTTLTEITSTVTITDAAFHHVALTNDGGTYQLFIDGRADSSMDISSSAVVTNSANLALGHIPGDASSLFAGVIDQFVIHDNQLSEAQIYAMAQTDVNGMGQVRVSVERVDWDTYSDKTLIRDRADEVTWDDATLDQATGLGSGWQHTFYDKENYFYIHVRGQDSGGEAIQPVTVWRGLIDHKPPVITASGEHLYGGVSAATTYVFTATDILLQESTLVHPCGVDDLTTLTYTSVPTDTPHYGQTYEIRGSCMVAGHAVSETISICDGVGHCSSNTIIPDSSNSGNAIEITSPALSETITSTAPLTISGDVWVYTTPFTVEIEVDNTLIDTLVYTSGITETTWATVWDITDARLHTIDVQVTSSNGNVSTDSSSFSVSGTCSVDYDGDNVTDYSGDSAAIRDGLTAVASGGTLRVAGICEGITSIGQSAFLAYLDKPVTIEGGYDASDWAAGSDPVNTPTILDVSENGRVFYVEDGTNITIKDMVLANGRGEDSESASWVEIDHGGAIYLVTGTDFTLDNVTIFNGTARENGGGLYMESGSVTVRDSEFIANQASAGGAIHISGTLTLVDSLIYNASGSEGGGVYVDNGTFVMTDSTIDDSSAAQGGAIFVQDGDMTISGSTVSHNEVYFGHGGGIHVNSGTFDITNSTISGNKADDNGGGFYNNSGTGTLRHVSVIDNEAGANGGGVHNESGTLQIQHSIIAYSTAGNDCSGTITDQGGNIASDASCSFGSSSLNSTDPMLDPLADNGGATETHNVQAGSPAIDFAVGSGMGVDQRGLARPQLAAADSGAVEYAGEYGGDCDPSPWNVGTTTELNQAIACYNSQTGGSATINFAQDVVLIDDTIGISNTTGAMLYIDGQGYSLDGNADYRGLSVENGEVDIYDLTIERGAPQGGDAGTNNGGGLLVGVATTVTVRSGAFVNNDARFSSGGAIANYGHLTVSETLFQDNSGFGGGDGASGGAHIANFGEMTLDKSLINGSETMDGGGVFNGASAVARITNSTFMNLLAYQYGSVIYNNGGTVDMIHVTAVNNTSGAGDFANVSGVMTMTLSALSNSLGETHCLGTISDGGGNIADDGTCGFTAGTSTNNEDPGMSTTLADNGGETETLAITSGSSAAAEAGTCVLDEDQRGVARPSGMFCDSGAFELEYTDIPVTTTVSINVTGDVTLDWDTDDSATNCDADVYQSGTPYDGHTLWQEDLTAWSVTDSAVEDNSFYLVWLSCDNGEAAVSEEIGVFQFDLSSGE